MLIYTILQVKIRCPNSEYSKNKMRIGIIKTTINYNTYILRK